MQKSGRRQRHLHPAVVARHSIFSLKMPSENLQEESLEKNPNLELAQFKFYLSLDEHKDDKATKDKLMAAIKETSKIHTLLF